MTTRVAVAVGLSLLILGAASWAGGLNTAGGLCPDGVQDHGEIFWEKLPDSTGIFDEQVSSKWDHVQMNVFICNDGTMMGRADFRRGTKGR